MFRHGLDESVQGYGNNDYNYLKCIIGPKTVERENFSINRSHHAHRRWGQALSVVVVSAGAKIDEKRCVSNGRFCLHPLKWLSDGKKNGRG